jgi:hypothetical protein
VAVFAVVAVELAEVPGFAAGFAAVLLDCDVEPVCDLAGVVDGGVLVCAAQNEQAARAMIANRTMRISVSRRKQKDANTTASVC